jgi:tripeptidyl-peptidase-1
MQLDRGGDAKLFASSGGFSNVFTRADYQAEAVGSYFDSNTFPFSSYNISAGESVGANGGVFNIGGRGIPDVSANGALFGYYVDGTYSPTGSGTSLSAPLWGAVVTLVRQSHLRKAYTDLYQDQ